MNMDELEEKGKETVNRIKEYSRKKLNESSTVDKGKKIITQARDYGQKVFNKVNDYKNEKEKQIKDIIEKELAIKAEKIEQAKKENLERLLSKYGNIEFKEDKIIVQNQGKLNVV